jgi:hypothetical protein
VSIRQLAPPLKPRTTFTLAHLMLEMWEAMEREAWSALQTLRVIQADSARTMYHGIPSILD